MAIALVTAAVRPAASMHLSPCSLRSCHSLFYDNHGETPVKDIPPLCGRKRPLPQSRCFLECPSLPATSPALPIHWSYRGQQQQGGSSTGCQRGGAAPRTAPRGIGCRRLIGHEDVATNASSGLATNHGDAHSTGSARQARVPNVVRERIGHLTKGGRFGPETLGLGQ